MVTNISKCVVATDVRLAVRESGVWANHSSAAYPTWLPLVDAFGSVTVLGRDDPSQEEAPLRVDGQGVTVIPVPTYARISGLLRSTPRVWRVMKSVGSQDDVFVGRLPEPLSLLLFLRSKLLGARFVSMVVSDPNQLFAAHFPGIPGRAVGWVAGAVTRAIVRRSAGVVYVSQSWLQGLYPQLADTPTLARSNVQLPESAFAKNRVERTSSKQALRLISVGSLTGSVKGPDLLIEVVVKLRDSGIDSTLQFIGGGQDLDLYRGMAANSEVGDSIEFVGHVTEIDSLRARLDTADVYVSASRAEGLPRATVEAMARGLAVVSTRAGAAAELVDSHWLVDVGSVDHIVERVTELRDAARRAEVGAKNQFRAREIQRTAAPENLSSFMRSHFVTD